MSVPVNLIEFWRTFVMSENCYRKGTKSLFQKPSLKFSCRNIIIACFAGESFLFIKCTLTRWDVFNFKVRKIFSVNP